MIASAQPSVCNVRSAVKKTSSERLSGTPALQMHQGACFAHRIGHVIIGVICSCDSTSREVYARDTRKLLYFRRRIQLLIEAVKKNFFATLF